MAPPGLRRPVTLTIAGSDPSGGAGVQADVKTFTALGTYATAVITALTSQNTQGVTGVHPVPADVVDLQLTTLLADVRIEAVKVGMLGSGEVVAVVGRHLAALRREGIPVVVDPVMVSTSGSRLLDEDAVGALRSLLPLASVLTPNAAEAASLLGTSPAESLAGLGEHADRLRSLGARRVLLTGGEPLGTPGEAVDVWADAAGHLELRADRIDTRNTHGTGCTLSSALAALRPQRDSWRVSARAAKAWVTEAIRGAASLDIWLPPDRDGIDRSGRGAGHGPLDHLHGVPFPTPPPLP